MLTLLAAGRAIRPATPAFHRTKCLAAVILLATASLAGCVRTAPPLIGKDPADPNAKVAGVGARSTIAPYRSMRPAAPSSWREQNDRVAPAQKSGQ